MSSDELAVDETQLDNTCLRTGPAHSRQRTEQEPFLVLRKVLAEETDLVVELPEDLVVEAL